jgi:RNA polymerase subunit RPABC4/transcription elongation factor Spt4
MDVNEKKCPHCGEIILAKAKKCKYCREWLEKSDEDQEMNGPAIVSGERQIGGSLGRLQRVPSHTNIRVCRDCGRDVSVFATKCPHCGASSPAISSGVYAIIILIALALCIWVFMTFGKACDSIHTAAQKMSTDLQKAQRTLDESSRALDRRKEK